MKASWIMALIGIGALAICGLVLFVEREPLCVGFAPPQGVRGDLIRLNSALNEFAIRNGGEYPLLLEELLSEVGGHPAVVSSRDQLLDPWGALFLYERIDEGPHLNIRLSTLGRDGRVGGTGEDADLHIGRGRWDDDL